MKPFDLRTHLRDKKSGAVIQTQPYTLHVIDGEEIFERPAKSGQFFTRSGEEHPGHAVVALQKENEAKAEEKLKALAERKKARAEAAKAAKALEAAKLREQEASLMKELSSKHSAAPAAKKE